MSTQSVTHATLEHGKKNFEIFVGDVKEQWKEPVVVARNMIASAGFSEPDRFVLEALDRRGGTPVAEFSPNESVDLNDSDRKFFRVTPGGGGRS